MADVAAAKWHASELRAVMESVDKWLDGDDLTANPATRAARAREVAMQWGESLNAKLAEVEKSHLAEIRTYDCCIGVTEEPKHECAEDKPCMLRRLQDAEREAAGYQRLAKAVRDSGGKSVFVMVYTDGEEVRLFGGDSATEKDMGETIGHWINLANIVELSDAQTKLAAAEKERDEARANYQFMVDRAADQKLDGYRELGARAAKAENDLDSLRAAVAHAAAQLAVAEEKAADDAPCSADTHFREAVRTLARTLPPSDLPKVDRAAIWGELREMDRLHVDNANIRAELSACQESRDTWRGMCLNAREALRRPDLAQDDDDGCPVNDPDCMGRSDQCHTACEAPKTREEDDGC